MMFEDAQVGALVSYTGDERNHGESSLIPPEGAIGEILKIGSEAEYNFFIRWDKEVNHKYEWWYFADMISPILVEEF